MWVWIAQVHLYKNFFSIVNTTVYTICSWLNLRMWNWVMEERNRPETRNHSWHSLFLWFPYPVCHQFLSILSPNHFSLFNLVQIAIISARLLIPSQLASVRWGFAAPTLRCPIPLSIPLSEQFSQWLLITSEWNGIVSCWLLFCSRASLHAAPA